MNPKKININVLKFVQYQYHIHFSEGSFDPEVPRVATGAEVTTISNVLSFVLKSLLDDVDVHRAIENLSEETIPYFTQISREEVR